MASTGQRYAVDIGTGAATGAATGSALGPWGALIGGVIGAGAGVVKGAVDTNRESSEQARLLAEEERQKKLLAIKMLRDRAARLGFSAEGVDANVDQEALNHGIRQNEFQFQQAHRIDPSAFVPIATAGAAAAGGIQKYNHNQALQAGFDAAQPSASSWGPSNAAGDAYSAGVTPGVAVGGPVGAGPSAAGESAVSTLIDELRRRGGY